MEDMKTFMNGKGIFIVHSCKLYPPLMCGCRSDCEELLLVEANDIVCSHTCADTFNNVRSAQQTTLMFFIYKFIKVSIHNISSYLASMKGHNLIGIYLSL